MQLSSVLLSVGVLQCIAVKLCRVLEWNRDTAASGSFCSLSSQGRLAPPIIIVIIIKAFVIIIILLVGPQNGFLEKVGHLAQPADPPPLPVSWAAKKRKKSLMFILHFRLF